MADDDHPLAGRYLVYKLTLSPKLADAGRWFRAYWQGPGDFSSWGVGDGFRATAPRFPNPTAARDALAAAGILDQIDVERVGYEWEPPTIERPQLPEPEGHPWPTSTCTSSPAN